jgi:hypothetical protein
MDPYVALRRRLDPVRKILALEQVRSRVLELL